MSEVAAPERTGRAADAVGPRGSRDVPSPPPAAPWTVLCVDDEPNILASLRRTLRGAGLRVLTAPGGAEALEILARQAEDQPIDVIVSDMRMPEMDGAQLLERTCARWPKLVRILLTGQADVESAVSAINRGRIQRYLRKPWDNEELLATIREGTERIALERERARLEALTQRQNAELATLNAELEERVQARTAELRQAHRRLEHNHRQSIKVFSSLLELRGDSFAGHGRRVADLSRSIALELGLPDAQVEQITTAGLLHDIGLFGAADRLMTKPVSRYSEEELALYRQHVVCGEQSLMALEEMQPILPMVRGHHERWDGNGFPDRLAGTAIPIGARILAIADAYDDLQTGHLVDSKLAAQSRTYLPLQAGRPCMSDVEAREIMARERGTRYCPQVYDAFRAVTAALRPAAATTRDAARPISSAALEPGMVLAQDLVSNFGVPMLMAGHQLTDALIRRVREFEQREGGSLRFHIQPRNDTPS